MIGIVKEKHFFQIAQNGEKIGPIFFDTPSNNKDLNSEAILDMSKKTVPPHELEKRVVGLSQIQTGTIQQLGKS